MFLIVTIHKNGNFSCIKNVFTCFFDCKYEGYQQIHVQYIDYATDKDKSYCNIEASIIMGTYYMSTGIFVIKLVLLHCLNLR